MNRAVLLREVANLRHRKEAGIEAMRISACAQKVTGHKMEDLTGATPFALAQVIRILKRGLARERWRGLARHRLYDLNRHIDLKKALDMARSLLATKNGTEAPF